jgi:hypothetical protein
MLSLEGVRACPYIHWGTELHGILSDTSLEVLPENYSGSFLLYQLGILGYFYAL